MSAAHQTAVSRAQLEVVGSPASARSISRARQLELRWSRRRLAVPLTSGGLVAVLAALAVVRSLTTWVVFDAQLIPDARLLVESGVGLFPSPIGTTLGALVGLHGLAVVNAFATGATVLLAAAIAKQLGGSPVLAAGLMLLMPAAFVTMYVGLDALGTALCLAALLAHLQGRGRRCAGFALAACLAHYSVIPMVVGGMLASGGRRAWVWLGAATVVAGGFGVALVTNYRPALDALDEPGSIVLWGALTLGLAGVWLLPLASRLVAPSPVRRILGIAMVAAGGTAGVMATVENGGTQVRYTLPVVALACATAAVARRSTESRDERRAVRAGRPVVVSEPAS